MDLIYVYQCGIWRAHARGVCQAIIGPLDEYLFAKCCLRVS